MALTKKEYEDFKSAIDKVVYKYVDYDRSTVVSLITHAVDTGNDKKKIENRLLGYVDKTVAFKLADKAFMTLEQISKATKIKKRPREEEKDMKMNIKKYKENYDFDNKEDKNVASGQMQAQQIKDLMAKAQATIEERKKALSLHAHTQSPNESADAPSSDVASRIAHLQARIQAQLGNSAPVGEIPKPTLLTSAQLPTYIPQPPPIIADDKESIDTKPANLILDSEGRTLDVTGKEVHLTHRVPTLKANIRAKKREEFKQQLQEKPTEETTEGQFFDPRVHMKSFVKQRRCFNFHEQGKYIQQAQRERAKSRLEKLQEQISQVAKKTGISSAAKLAQLEQREMKEVSDRAPAIEWWDSILLGEDRYPPEGEPVKVKEGLITNLVEHPMQMKGPKDVDKKIELHVFLTKKERKKLRRMNRRETWKEKQEKIRLGLEPPPEPKVRMANLMRVLGTEAVIDPTKMEKHVREQMAKRLKTHQDANAKRKLTPQQRKDKKKKKLQEDTSTGVKVAIYRVTDLTNGAHKFKVETNAKQLHMSGTVVLFKDVNVIIVEGGPKQQQKYKRLMLERIKWTERARSAKDTTTETKCHLIWEGSATERGFSDIQFKSCPTEAFAREHFKRHGVEQYWDLAYGTKILEEAEEAL